MEVHVPASTETKQRTKSLMLKSKTGSDEVQDQMVADEGKASQRKVISFN